MTIYIPWGLLAIFMAFYFSYSHTRRTRLRREEKKENLDSRNQALLDYLHRWKEKKEEGSKLIQFQETGEDGLYNLAFGDKTSGYEFNDVIVTDNGDIEKVLALTIL